MDGEDDDFYAAEAQQQDLVEDGGEADVKVENADMNEQEDEDEESEDDVQFTLDAKPDAKAETKPEPAAKRKRTSSPKPAPKATTPAVKTEKATAAPKPAAPTTISNLLTHNDREGKDFPAPHISQLDLTTIPLYNARPLTSLDIDADLANHSKPWRLPGTDQTDFFNYGFDEYTWTQYCLKQQSMAGNISEMKANDERMRAMFGGGGGGGAPPGMGMGMGGGGGGMGGMPPDMEAMMSMMGGGGPPPGMDFGGFMGGGQGMMGQQGTPMGQGGFQAPGFQQQGQGGFGGQQGRGSASPAPGNGGGSNTEGYSAQQLAMLQNEQGGGMRGGRGGGRRGRW
ncbi:hypothetical protein LTR15_004867 [Elasticomyces elasticus]|nr:hypothetical protein LTR15_004867 [Elasticomyces elasticus]